MKEGGFYYLGTAADRDYCESDAQTFTNKQESGRSSVDNLYVHCYRQNYAVNASDSFWGSALDYIIHLTGASIP